MYGRSEETGRIQAPRRSNRGLRHDDNSAHPLRAVHHVDILQRRDGCESAKLPERARAREERLIPTWTIEDGAAHVNRSLNALEARARPCTARRAGTPQHQGDQERCGEDRPGIDTPRTPPSQTTVPPRAFRRCSRRGWLTSEGLLAAWSPWGVAAGKSAPKGLCRGQRTADTGGAPALASTIPPALASGVTTK